MIEVVEKNGSEFEVTVTDKNSRSVHRVSVDDDYYIKLTGEVISRKDLIKKSFEFLLEREPAESIISKFNLKIISQYFPEYEGEIKKRVKPR